MSGALKNKYFGVRHGESEANALGIIVSSAEQGVGGFGLSPLGRSQAQMAGEHLLARLGPSRAAGALVVCSDFLRTKQTAGIVATTLGAAEPKADARLRERFFGTFDKGPNKEYKTVWRRDAEDPNQTADGVESVQKVAERAQAVVAEIEAEHAGRAVILVAHGDTLGILATAMAGLPLGKHRRVALEVAEVRTLGNVPHPTPPPALPANMATTTPGRVINLLSSCIHTHTRPGCPRFVTIGISHYCEKARWALDLAGIDYTEDMHPPGLHMLASLPASDFKATMTPLLVLPDGRKIWDSERILTYLSETYPERLGSLYPDVHVRGWEDYFGTVLGPASRIYAYYHLLKDKTLTVRMMTQNISTVESALLRLIFPKLAATMIKSFPINEVTAAHAKENIKEAFQRVSENLADGRAFICGPTLTAADISFAALTYPLLCAPAVTVLMGTTYNEMPAAVREFVEELRATPAGKHGLRLYERHRPLSAQGQLPLRLAPPRSLVPTVLVGTAVAAAAIAAVKAWVF